MPRTLLIRERDVPAAHTAGYASAWRDLEVQVKASGANAWCFRARDIPDRYIEFIEWRVGPDAGADTSALRPAIAAAEQALETIAVSSPRGTWEEWNIE